MGRHSRASTLLAVALIACAAEPALVAGSVDSYELTARVRRAIPAGANEAGARHVLTAQGFHCVRTDTLQSDEGDTLQANTKPDEPGIEYLTCDWVRGRRWGEHTRRRYLVVLYIREHRVEREFAVTHLLEVH